MEAYFILHGVLLSSHLSIFRLQFGRRHSRFKRAAGDQLGKLPFLLGIEKQGERSPGEPVTVRLSMLKKEVLSNGARILHLKAGKRHKNKVECSD